MTKHTSGVGGGGQTLCTRNTLVEDRDGAKRVEKKSLESDSSSYYKAHPFAKEMEDGTMQCNA